MNTLKLSMLIGKEITDIKFHYTAENEYGLQEFYAYILLDDEIIIGIPMFDGDD